MASFKLGFIGEGNLQSVRADAEFAREHGFDGLEYNFHPKAFNPTHPGFPDVDESLAKDMRKILDDQGIRCAMMGLWGYNHISPDAKEKAEALECLGRAIDLAQILGAEVFTTGGGDIPDAPMDRKAEAFCETMPPYIERVEAAGMVPAFYAVHSRSFFDSIEAYQAVWEKLPQVRIKYDPANWRHHGSDYLAIARHCGDKIGHVHIKEHLYHDGDLASQPAAGMGDIDFGKVMAFLYEHDYHGYLVMEPHGPVWAEGEMRRTMLRLSQRYIRQFLV